VDDPANRHHADQLAVLRQQARVAPSVALKINLQARCDRGGQNDGGGFFEVTWPSFIALF
jgi:hypothetical protein